MLDMMVRYYLIDDNNVEVCSCDGICHCDLMIVVFEMLMSGGGGMGEGCRLLTE